MPTIVIDAMGGHHGPETVVQGVAQASITTEIDCLLVGDERRIQAVLDTVPYNADRIEVVHCPGAVGGKDTSLIAGLQAVAAGRADAMVSAGSTRASVLGVAQHFMLLPGVRRAALASVFPRQIEYPGQDPLALLVDVGATVHCQAVELTQFALMGAAYARRVSKLASPRIGLLNMGREDSMGGEVLVEAFRSLRGLTGLHFVGNVEGHELVRGKADVIVCDGFTGNVVRKLLAGFGEVMGEVTKAVGEQKSMWRAGLKLPAPELDRVRALAEYAHYGGSPILGFRQLFITCHSRASARAIANAVKVAAKAVRDRVPAEVADAVSTAR